MEAHPNEIISGYGFSPFVYNIYHPEIVYNNVGTPYGEGAYLNDVLGVALNLDSGTLTYYKNGTSLGVASTNISGTFRPGTFCGTNSSQSENYNFGQSSWLYTPPPEHVGPQLCLYICNIGSYCPK